MRIRYPTDPPADDDIVGEDDDEATAEQRIEYAAYEEAVAVKTNDLTLLIAARKLREEK